MKNIGSSRNLYFLIGFVSFTLGALCCWIVMTIVGPLLMIKRMQKEIDRSKNGTEKFSDFQKHMNEIQRNFPMIGNLSEEKINNMIESLQINRQRNTSEKKSNKEKSLKEKK